MAKYCRVRTANEIQNLSRQGFGSPRQVSNSKNVGNVVSPDTLARIVKMLNIGKIFRETRLFSPSQGCAGKNKNMKQTITISLARKPNSCIVKIGNTRIRSLVDTGTDISLIKDQEIINRVLSNHLLAY